MRLIPFEGFEGFGEDRWRLLKEYIDMCWRSKRKMIRKLEVGDKYEWAESCMELGLTGQERPADLTNQQWKKLADILWRDMYYFL